MKCSDLDSTIFQTVGAVAGSVGTQCADVMSSFSASDRVCLDEHIGVGVHA